MTTDLPKFTIIMATLNSERTIEKSLASIRSQDYPQNLVEILVYDGGSIDKTRAIADKYQAIIKENPDVEPVSAKLKGYNEAAGDLLIYVDSDEVFESQSMLKKRALLFREEPEVVMCFSSGYRNPPNYPFINEYINSYGDPFTAFYYRISKHAFDCIVTIRKKLRVAKETNDYILFDIKSSPSQGIFENAALGATIRLDFFRNNYSHLKEDRWGPVHLFYHMQNKIRLFAITKEDSIEHYSADTLKSYLRKIKWRIINNIFFKERMGKAGFSGREEFENNVQIRFKKYLFLPYSLLIIPAFLDSLRISLQKKDFRFISHSPLCFYTGTLILFYFFLNILGYKPSFRSYGGTQNISTKNWVESE